MNHRLAATLLAVLLSTDAAWSDDQLVRSVIPDLNIGGKANIYYCDALVGSVIEGLSKKVAADFPHLAKHGIPPGTMQVSTQHPTDRIVIVIESDQKTFSVSSRHAFEAGGNGTAAPAPYQILEFDENYLVGTAVGVAGASSSSLISIDRKQGLGTWSDTITRDMISGVPRVESYVLSCGNRQP